MIHSNQRLHDLEEAWQQGALDKTFRIHMINKRKDFFGPHGWVVRQDQVPNADILGDSGIHVSTCMGICMCMHNVHAHTNARTCTHVSRYVCNHNCILSNYPAMWPKEPYSMQSRTMRFMTWHQFKGLRNAQGVEESSRCLMNGQGAKGL